MLSKDLNVCVLPLEIKWDDINFNIENFKQVLTQIHPQTDLLILPETFITGFPIEKNKEGIIASTRQYSQIISELLKEAARKQNMAICGSMIWETNNGKNQIHPDQENSPQLTNSAFFVEPNGEVFMSPKAHLFSMAKEHLIFSNSKEKLIIRFRGWNIALAVCYDLRFPVWSRNINNEYDLLIYVANWPEKRINAWDTLLPARAIENQSYVIGVNCKGIDNVGNHYNGSSAIIDYKGNYLERYSTNDTKVNNSDNIHFLYSRLSNDKLKLFREKFPAWRDADRFSLI